MSEALILQGPMIYFSADPFEAGAQAALRYEADGALAIVAGRIAQVGQAALVRAAFPEAQLRMYPNRLLAPGFVDAHVHYPQTRIIASYGAQLLDWLNTYTFPEESKFSDSAYAQSVAKIFFDEVLRNGITTSCSFCTSHPASVDAFFSEAKRRGVRALGGKVMMDRNAPAGVLDEAQRSYDESLALARRWADEARLGYVVSPRFAPTSSAAQLEAAGALWAQIPGALMQTHLSENPQEIEWVADLFPNSQDYLDVYESFGLCAERAVFGHAIHLTQRERDRLAECGASIAHCPTSNLFLGSGACDVKGLAQSGVRVGLATDVGGGSSFSMFATMRAAYEIGQSRGYALSAVHLWWMASQGAARALHLGENIGNLEEGLEADVIVLNPKATPLLAHRTDRADTADELMFALINLADDRAVEEVWSNGERLIL